MKVDDLPDELKLKIISYCNIKDLLTLSLVSKEFNSFSNQDQFWKLNFSKNPKLKFEFTKDIKNRYISHMKTINSSKTNNTSFLKIITLGDYGVGYFHLIFKNRKSSFIEHLIFKGEDKNFSSIRSECVAYIYSKASFQKNINLIKT
jgi:hypothetical protein